MRFFYVEQDPEYKDLPQFIDWNRGRRFSLNRKPKHEIWGVKTSDNTFFPNALLGEQFLVRDEIFSCLQLFEPNVAGEKWLLFDVDKKNVEEYVSVKMYEYESLEAAPADRTFFKVRDLERENYVFRQDALECIFRRGLDGIIVKEI